MRNILAAFLVGLLVGAACSWVIRSWKEGNDNLAKVDQQQQDSVEATIDEAEAQAAARRQHHEIVRAIDDCDLDRGYSLELERVLVAIEERRAPHCQVVSGGVRGSNPALSLEAIARPGQEGKANSPKNRVPDGR